MSKLITILALSAIALLAQSCERASALDLKGVELAAIPAPGQLQAALGVSATPPPRAQPGGLPSASGSYSGDTEISGLPVHTRVTLDDAGRVVWIVVTFQSAFFESLEAAAIAKWGKPTISGSVQMQTGYGASVLAIEHDWTTPEHFSASILNHIDATHGQLVLETEEHQQTRRHPAGSSL